MYCGNIENRESAASEAIGGILLISVVVLAVAILGVVLTSQGTPQKLPAVSAIISSSGNQISIYHDGGDSLSSNELSILVNGNPVSFRKGGSDTWTWSVGDTLVNGTPVTGTVDSVRVVYTPGAYTIAFANFAGLETGPVPTTSGTVPPTSSPAPSVSGITPSAGVSGSTVAATLAGNNFHSGATVRLTRPGYSDIPGSSVGFVSATQLTCTFNLAGAAAGQWNVVLTNPDGQNGSLPDSFTVSNAAPTVTGISPSSGYSGLNVEISNITGTNFLNGATVTFRRGTDTITATNTTVISSLRISCTADLSGAATGTWDVVVTNPDLQSGTGSTMFTVMPALAPTVSAMTPNTGNRGWPVTITSLTGSNFQSGATVQLLQGSGTITATNVTVVSPTEITCTFSLTGAPAGLWSVRVINPDLQSGTGTGLFTVFSPAPTINGITPNSYIRGWTVQVTSLTGSDFQPGATVQLRRGSSIITASDVTVVSGGVITCTFDLSAVPSGTWNTQSWDIRVINNDTQFSTATGIFTVTNYVPTISQIVPNAAQRYATFNATVNGNNFQPGITAVQLRRSGTTISSTNITVLSPTQLTCTFTIPYNAPVNSDYYIRVVNPGSRNGNSDSMFSITAGQPPTVTGISPVSGRHGVLVNPVVVTGTGFQPGARVRLYRGTSLLYTAPAGTVTGNQITTSFSVGSGVTPGSANVRVTNMDGQYFTLANAYTILT